MTRPWQGRAFIDRAVIEQCLAKWLPGETEEDMTAKKRILAALVVFAAATIAIYWYLSPYLAVRDLQTAAQKRDADALNDKVDYPAVRESLKGQFSSRVAGLLAQQGTQNNPIGALGTAIGLAMLNQFVEAIVRPEVIMYALSTGEVKPTAPGRTPPTVQEQEPIHWAFDRKGVDRLIAYPRRSGNLEAKGDDLGFVFQRRGFADWKLTEIRMPVN